MNRTHPIVRICIVPLVVWGLIMIVCFGWLTYDKQSADLNSFLHQNPYGWLGVEQVWAEPDINPNIQHPRPDQWMFSLYPPAGYSEIHIIPEHKELCTYEAHGNLNCVPFVPK